MLSVLEVVQFHWIQATCSKISAGCIQMRAMLDAAGINLINTLFCFRISAWTRVLADGD